MTLIASVIGLVTAIVVAVAQIWYQEKSPCVSVSCTSAANGNPAELTCTVANDGRAEARDVFVSFNGFLPTGTRVRGESQAGIEVVESNLVVDQAFADTLKETKAFSVKVARVRARASVPFTVYTDDPDNLRAAKQLLFLGKMRERVVDRFLDEAAKVTTDVAGLDRVAWRSSAAKDDTFFQPAFVSSAEAERPVVFLTSAELRARALFGDLYRLYKPQFLSLFADGGDYLAPVVRIKTSSGQNVHALFPMFPSTYVEGGPVPVIDIVRTGKVELSPTVPAHYEADSLDEATGLDAFVASGGRKVPFISEPMKIDGALTETSWSKALRFGTTTQPGNAPVADFLTINDDKFLYLAADAGWSTTNHPPHTSSRGEIFWRLCSIETTTPSFPTATSRVPSASRVSVSSVERSSTWNKPVPKCQRNRALPSRFVHRRATLPRIGFSNWL